MVIYTKELYENIFGKFSLEASSLKIISGYSSSGFLKRVLQQFPHLSLDLFLGMTYQGISKEDHEQYKKIVKENPKVNIFYQITNKPTHMKIYSFYSSINNKTTNFIGSANFSENGFLVQREILTNVADNLENLFLEQSKYSKSCLDKDIEKYVPFLNNEFYTDSEQLMTSTNIASSSENDDLLIKENKESFNNKTYIKNLETVRMRTNLNFYDTFKVEIVLDGKRDKHWASKGINACFEEKEPVLIGRNFPKLFPVNKKFKIYTTDGEEWDAVLTGRFDGHISVLNVNLYNYVRKCIGLKEIRPISYNDLLEVGKTEFHFERINEIEYIMSFI